MDPTEGKKPAPVDPVERQYVLDKLAEVRKSCEWLVTLGAANIFANLLKAPSSDSWLRKWTLCLAAGQMLVALLGATSWLSESVYSDQVSPTLRKTLERRYMVRNISLFLLVIALAMLLVQLW